MDLSKKDQILSLCYHNTIINTAFRMQTHNGLSYEETLELMVVALAEQNAEQRKLLLEQARRMPCPSMVLDMLEP